MNDLQDGQQHYFRDRAVGGPAGGEAAGTARGPLQLCLLATGGRDAVRGSLEEPGIEPGTFRARY